MPLLRRALPQRTGVTTLARVEVSTNNPETTILQIAKGIRAIDRCSQGGESLLQATVVDVGTSEVLFMGIFYEEALLCNGLPPR